MKRIIIYLFIVCVCVGCATKREASTTIRVVEVHDTLRENVLHTDSVFVRDSVRVWMQGDTIYHDRWRVEYRDKWRDRIIESVKIKSDTLVQRDTLYIQKKTPLFQCVRRGIGDAAIAIIIIFLVYYLVKKRVFHC